MADAFGNAWLLLKQGYEGYVRDPKTAAAMDIFQQVQAAKLARQQQRMNAGLNPMTGAAQPQQPVPSMVDLPPVSNQTPCPTCGGTGVMSQ